MGKSTKRIVQQWHHDPEKLAAKLEKLDSKNNVHELHPKNKRMMAELKPKTQAQAEFINAMKTKAQVIGLGPAGTGKTFCVASLAAKMLMEGSISKIVLTRPNVSSSKSLGFFPGSLEEKFGAWTIPFTSIIKEHFGASYYEYCLKSEKIEMVPFETMRGRSFEDAFVIVDEAQSTSVEEMKCLVTRIGEGSRLVMIGDIAQKDIKMQSGLEMVVDMWHRADAVKQFVDLVEFEIDDIVRSDVCAMWVRVLSSRGI